jgi:hypothetical protein
LLLRQEDKGNFCCKNAVAGVYTILRLHLDDTKTYDIVPVFAPERVLSNIFSDIDVWTFNLKQVLTLVGRLLQLKLQFDQVVKFSGTTTLIATFQPGYEGFN